MQKQPAYFSRMCRLLPPCPSWIIMQNQAAFLPWHTGRWQNAAAKLPTFVAQTGGHQPIIESICARVGSQLLISRGKLIPPLIKESLWMGYISPQGIGLMTILPRTNGEATKVQLWKKCLHRFELPRTLRKSHTTWNWWCCLNGGYIVRCVAVSWSNSMASVENWTIEGVNETMSM